MELVNDRANQACGRAIGRAPQRVPDLVRQGAVLEQQRKQNGGISRERIQHRVLLGGVEEYLANGAVREAPDLHPKMMAGVLELDGDRASALRKTTAQDHVDEPCELAERLSAVAAQPAVTAENYKRALTAALELDPRP